MNEPAKSFEDLFVWQKAHQLVLSVYKATKAYPKSELYGLVSQMRRAAVSVPANIAEGFKKRTAAEKCRSRLLYSLTDRRGIGHRCQTG